MNMNSMPSLGSLTRSIISPLDEMEGVVQTFDEDEELKTALASENQNDFKGAIATYLMLLESGTVKARDQFLAMLEERGGAEHVFNYCLSMLGEIDNAQDIYNHCVEEQMAAPVGMLICLGIMHLHGAGVSQNNDKAQEFLKLAHEYGGNIASFMLGEMHLNGHGVEQDHIQARNYLKLATNVGYGAKSIAVQLFDLGEKYFHGDDEKRDYTASRKYFKIASMMGHANASVRMGEMYLYGLGVDPDYVKAKGYFDDADQWGNESANRHLQTLERNIVDVVANKGDRGDLLALGYLFFDHEKFETAFECFILCGQKQGAKLFAPQRGFWENVRASYGSNVKRDFSEAADYFKSRAKEGCATASFFLGLMFAKELGVKQHFILALRYLKLASEKGEVRASVELGLIYLKDYFKVGQDPNEAIRFFKLAIDQGCTDPYVLEQLGRIYYFKGVNDDIDNVQSFVDAISYFEKAAEKGSIDALRYLAKIYINGHGVEKDVGKAIGYLEWAEQEGDTQATSELGLLYFEGVVVDRDYKKSHDYLVKIYPSIKFNPVSNCLGIMYLCGLGVQRDCKKAYLFFLPLAQIDDAMATNYLGLMCLNGLGVRRDTVLGRTWFEKSAGKGNAMALHNLGILHFYGDGVIPLDYRKAYILFKQSAARGNADALNRLGAYRFIGRRLGVTQDFSKALSYFKRSAEKGYATAFDNLGNMYAWGKGVEINIKIAEDYYRQARECREKNALAMENQFIISAQSIMRMQLGGNRRDQIDSLF